MSTAKQASTRVANKNVGPVGYGLLGLSLPLPFPQVERHVAVELMEKALEQGANLWNGKYPEDADKVVLSIKRAYNMKTGPSGSPEVIRASVEEALRVLGGTKCIDIFELARINPNTPVETSVKALAELVQEGKIGGIGLSEVSANTIRKAHAVHPIAAVEIELSLFTPDPLQNGILETCHELAISVIAYSPVGRGWLTGKYRTIDDLDDLRRMFSRFQPDVFDQNLKLVEAVEEVAKRKGLTTSQVAIPRAAQQGTIPIPGSSNADRVVLNSHVSPLTDEDMLDLQKILDTFPVASDRYPKAHRNLLNA